MHLQPVFAGSPVYGGDVSARLFERGLCLPSGSAMTDDDQDRVVSHAAGDATRARKAYGVAATSPETVVSTTSSQCDQRSLRPLTVSR